MREKTDGSHTRFGYAIDLHASPSTSHEVEWLNLREQAPAAGKAGLDLMVLPDHLSYSLGIGGAIGRDAGQVEEVSVDEAAAPW